MNWFADNLICLREVEVPHQPALASTFEQSQQSRALGNSRLATDENDQSAVRHGCGEVKKIIAIAADKNHTFRQRVAQNRFIARFSGEDFAKEGYLMARHPKHLTDPLRHIVIEQEAHPLRFTHLPGNQQVNHRAMIFVIGEAFIDLRASQVRKTARDRVHRLAILQKPYDVMDTNARSFNARLPTAGSFLGDDVTISGRRSLHGDELTYGVRPEQGLKSEVRSSGCRSDEPELGFGSNRGEPYGFLSSDFSRVSECFTP